MEKLLRINLESKKFWYEDVPDVYANLGGRGLTSKIVSEEVPPKADALGKENKLIFAPGILAGTVVPNTGRLSVGAKSPLTGTIKEANSGGAAAHKLARLGIRGVIIEGTGKDLTLIKITKDGVNFIPADNFKGMGNYNLIDKLKNAYGENIAIISIGLGGENILKTASVAVTTPDFKIRMASRGGLGAVMGSKKLKAIIIDDTDAPGIKVKDEKRLKEATAELTKGILSHPLIEALKQFGTPVLVMMINTADALPTKNYSIGQFEHAQQISGEFMLETMGKRPNSQTIHRCMAGCIIGCSNIYTDEKGKEIVSGLEYETIGLIGSNCMIGNLDDIARLNWLCNDIGIDTMEIGAAIAVSMEGGLLPWGDGKAAYALIEETIKGTKNGILIGNGCVATGKALGVKRIPHVKGQSLAAYDPRVLKGTGVTYATCPMGADHTAGNALPSPANPEYNPTSPAGQNEISQFLQWFFAAIDSLGMCLFASLPLLDMPDLTKHLIDCATSVTGQAPIENYLMKLGVSVLQWEKRFNRAAGFTEMDDRLPDFFINEPLPPSGLIFDVSEADIDATLNL